MTRAKKKSAAVVCENGTEPANVSVTALVFRNESPVTPTMYFRFVFVAGLATSCSLLSAQEPVLSLEDAFAAVEPANLSVLVSREAVAQTRAIADQQRAGLRPRVSLDGQQRRSQTVTVTNSGPVESAPGNRFDGKLTGTYSLLNPSQILAYRAARQGVAIAEADYLQSVQTALYGVGQVFFTHLRNLQRVSVFDANIARARALLDLATKQLDAGVATQIDVTRAEAQLAITEQARLQQDTVVYQSELQLKRLLNMESSVLVRLAPFAVQRIEQDPLAIGAEQAAYSKRPDYVRASEAVNQSQQSLRAAKLERVGALNLFGEYGYASARVLDGNEKKAWVGGASVSVPVFDGGRTHADYRIALATLRAQEYRLRNVELAIGSELRLAAQDAHSRFVQIGVAERSLRLAEDELRLAQLRFERGAADNREVVEAQNRLALASDNRVEAVYLYNLSRLELSRARGEVRDILKEKAP